MNVAKHDVSNWKENYDLLIHELAHFYVQRNDHLFAGFWAACSNIGAKLANVARTHPKLFPKPFNNFANDDDLGLLEDEEEAA